MKQWLLKHAQKIRMSFKSKVSATKKNPRSHSESLYVTYLDLNKVLLRVAERAAEAPQHRLHAVQFICVSRASLHRWGERGNDTKIQ